MTKTKIQINEEFFNRKNTWLTELKERAKKEKENEKGK